MVPPERDKGEMKMSEIELKPCPFCGCKAEILRGNSYGLAILYEPHCSKCECGVGIYNTEAEAVEAWNWRADNG